MKLLRAYCLGDKPIHMQFLSDQNVNFRERLQQTVNYEDPNLNVSIPVFSIHGNHDDSNGFGRLSSLDLLSTVGLLNYFGKWADLEKVELSPLMFRKGNTRLALYGLSYIHDNRLTRLFSEAKVVMNKPDDGNEWFNIMTVHQNRVDRGLKNYLPESILPDFLDLVKTKRE
jgi:double-strand break repair protein MRE11